MEFKLSFTFDNSKDEDDILNLGNQMFSAPIDFHTMDNKILFKSMGAKQFGYQHSSKYLLSCSTEEKEAIQ